MVDCVFIKKDNMKDNDNRSGMKGVNEEANEVLRLTN